jgi:hypothetical protein
MTLRRLQIYFAFAAPEVSMRKSIFLASFGGVKLNSASVNFGAKSQLLTSTVICGSPVTFFEVRINLCGRGLALKNVLGS